ncbi:hypothetical protein QQF64_023668 [Cirrhinus molitorella]|uniref:DDE-1 domain-containing protein n=1 Tax=Cirrhinus molitorella TaxID=172907 RepID=A0ABR3NJ77_9TELE
MPRDRKRKTDRGVPLPILSLAADVVTTEGRTVRSVAKQYSICHTTLYRYIKKRERLGPGEEMRTGYWTPRRVFSAQQEDSLAEYLKRAADLFYGLSSKEVRRLAFQLAVHYKCSYPETWNECSLAGRDWFMGFMKRQPRLSIRCPQPTSLTRNTSFNRHNVSLFYDNLANVLDKYKFEAKDIWNMDETGVTTVQEPENVVAGRGVRQVGAVTSGERGTLVTVACAGNALGNMIPPMFIFPRVNFKDHFIRYGPPGCIGAANKSGWMLEDHFLQFLEHFHHHTRASLDAKVLLILDNHSSHLSVRGIDFCRKNGIVMLSFPPHCSHKLQPLDRTVYGPLKRHVNAFCDTWMRSHPGLTMSIYDIPGIVRLALPLAGTAVNVQNGFSSTGIWPYNRDKFNASDFAPSLVTDRPPPPVLPEQAGTSAPSAVPLVQAGTSAPSAVPPVQAGTSAPSAVPPVQAGTSAPSAVPPVQAGTSDPSGVAPVQVEFSPETVRPHPRAGPRKLTKANGRKKRKSAILTDTPEKEALERDKAKVKRKPTNVKRKLTKNTLETNQQTKVGLKKTKKKKHTEDSDSEKEEDFCIVCLESYSRPGELKGGVGQLLADHAFVDSS